MEYLQPAFYTERFDVSEPFQSVRSPSSSPETTASSGPKGKTQTYRIRRYTTRQPDAGVGVLLFDGGFVLCVLD
ncbi:hypothetical protein MHYP_G00208280 [Metynnis hypsauchen]